MELPRHYVALIRERHARARRMRRALKATAEGFKNIFYQCQLTDESERNVRKKCFLCRLMVVATNTRPGHIKIKECGELRQTIFHE